MLISMSIGRGPYGGVELPKSRGIFLNFRISRTWNPWNLRITDTEFKFIKFLYWLQAIYTNNTEIPTNLYVSFLLTNFLLYFLQPFLTCGKSFILSTKLHKLRTLDKWIKIQYVTKYSGSKPNNKIIKSKPSF